MKAKITKKYTYPGAYLNLLDTPIEDWYKYYYSRYFYEFIDAYCTEESVENIWDDLFEDHPDGNEWSTYEYAAGTYILKEESCPKGYVLDTQDHTLVLEAAVDEEGYDYFTGTLDGEELGYAEVYGWDRPCGKLYDDIEPVNTSVEKVYAKENDGIFINRIDSEEYTWDYYFEKTEDGWKSNNPRDEEVTTCAITEWTISLDDDFKGGDVSVSLDYFVDKKNQWDDLQVVFCCEEDGYSHGVYILYGDIPDTYSGTLTDSYYLEPNKTYRIIAYYYNNGGSDSDGYAVLNFPDSWNVSGSDPVNVSLKPSITYTEDYNFEYKFKPNGEDWIGSAPDFDMTESMWKIVVDEDIAEYTISWKAEELNNPGPDVVPYQDFYMSLDGNDLAYKDESGEVTVSLSAGTHYLYAYHYHEGLGEDRCGFTLNLPGSENFVQLPGARLQIIDKDGEVVDEWTSDGT
ncbi:MAG: hypothetical protein HUJ76_12550, partial [Parasporobacterium sp.]|nr:hypothetical protein [Parasporobacterium sp.]